jgi:hypothetical protein
MGTYCPSQPSLCATKDVTYLAFLGSRKGEDPSEKVLARERTKLREMTSAQQNGVPIPQLLGELNRHLKNRASYFRYGYLRHAFGQINSYA